MTPAMTMITIISRYTHISSRYATASLSKKALSASRAQNSTILVMSLFGGSMAHYTSFLLLDLVIFPEYAGTG